MKILRLDLLAFGPFSGLSLELDQGAQGGGLHVVYGPNEAGKSSSLRALRQLLYGIPHASSDNFIHAYTNLRIGGLLENAAGERLPVIRRKGRSKTLRGPDDSEAVEESLLQGMLGGVEEGTFSQRFGIDYEELRRGGEAVVRGGGDLSGILFAAGAGIADVHQVQSRIDSEMQSLFKPGGSNPRINEAIRQLKTAREEIRGAQLLTSAWVEHDRGVRSGGKRQQEIDAELRKKRAQQSRLERIDKALPLIGRRERLGEELAEVAEAPLLPDDFSSHRSKAVTELANARKAERDASNVVGRLQDEVSRLNVPRELLEHRTAITRLHTDLGSYLKAASDRPDLVARLETLEQQTRRILQDLGRDPELDQADRLRLSRAQRQRIQSLAGDCKARLDRQRSTGQALGRLRDQIERLESQFAALPGRRDVSELARAVRRAGRHGDLDRQLLQAESALQELQRQAEVDLDRLALWSGTLDELERLPVPAFATVDRFEHEFARAESTVGRIEERTGELAQQAQKHDQSLERLRLEQDVPTEEDLARSRQRRDEGWQLVRQVWCEGLPADDPLVSAFLDEFAPGGDLAGAFQSSVESVDAIADRLRREADRVAEKAKLTADRQDLDRQLAEQRELLTSARGRLEQLQAEWRDQWSPLNVHPLSPREMRSWLGQQKELADAQRAIRKQREAAGSVAELARSLCGEFSRALQKLGQPPPEANALTAALEQCETLVEAIEAENRQRLDAERTLKTLKEDLSEAEQNSQQAEADLEQWRSEWAQAVAALGMDRDASPSEANSVIEAVDELLRLREDASELRGRIEGIDREAGEFQQAVRRLLAQAAADVADLPVDQAIADLYDRLQAASTAQTKLDGWKEQLEAENSKREAARSGIQQWQAEIESLCRQAGCPSPDELPAAEQRASRRQEVERALKGLDEQLHELAAGGPLEEFLALAEQADPDQLRADLQRLDEDIAQLDGERTEVAEMIGSHRNELRRMDGSGRAAEAQEQYEHLLARIRGDAEHYVRLRLASVVLSRAIERYREASQGPVLSRASELFSELTLGSFGGLRADYDEKGNAVLVGTRGSNGQQTVGVDGMSEGTCDQLYLSLRLSLLESYLGAHEPMPFIVDDILIMFDDGRAVAALKTLARLSERTQVIFFTHHEHLVKLARENLDADVLFTHTLDQRIVS